MIFLDTGAFIARYIQRDQHHPAATQGFRRLAREETPLVTSCHVLDETMTLLARWAGAGFAAERGRAMIASRSLRILRPTEEQELAALEDLERFADQGVSFTDALSFVLLRALGIREVFGFDRHFLLAGFALWPSTG